MHRPRGKMAVAPQSGTLVAVRLSASHMHDVLVCGAVVPRLSPVTLIRLLLSSSCSTAKNRVVL